MIVEIASISITYSLLTSSVIIGNSGQVTTSSSLRTEGRWIKDADGNTLILKGVWKAEYADSCVGWWGNDPYNWNEAAVRADMQNLRDVWHVNCLNTFIWGNWWEGDLAVTLGGGTTSHHYRWVLKETARLAAEYGLYFQIRLWEPSTTEGSVDQPYYPYSNYWTEQQFTDFWVSVANEMKAYPNVLLCLYDEPVHGETDWFRVANNTIFAIRATGCENLIVNHLDYCGDCMWMERWVQAGYPTHNIVFSNHIYRFHGTYAYDPNSATDYQYILSFLSDKPSATRYTGAGYKYITDTYNIPIWVSEIGAYNGATNDAEYTYFNNTLHALNELQLGYCAYQWFRSSLPWYVGYRMPNRVGQALIDAIMSG